VPPNRLKELREGMGVSRELLAHECVVTTKTIDRWEAGTIPSPRLAWLARRFETTIGYLLAAESKKTAARR
jgi:transcriptional regulator with XRE-family HTH domain